MVRIDSIAVQAEKDRDFKRLVSDKESKLASEIELEKLKQSFEMKTELEKQKSENLAHARDPKLPYFDESKEKMDNYLFRFEKYATANKWDKSVRDAYLSALLKGRALEVYDRLLTEDAADYEKSK